MKFALHLRENLVPEWRDQYLNYKLGKKKLKRLPRPKDQENTGTTTGFDRGVTGPPISRHQTTTHQSHSDEEHPRPDALTEGDRVTPGDILKVSRPNDEYGTISQSETAMSLPPPAITHQNIGLSGNISAQHQGQQKSYELNDRSPLLTANRSNSVAAAKNQSPGLSPLSPNVFQSVDRQMSIDSFLQWLDGEVDKIDGFYSRKEQEAVEQYLVMQDQLIRMSEHRVRAKKARKQEGALSKAALTTHKVIARKIELPSLPEMVKQRTSNPSAESHNQTQSKDDYMRRSDEMVPYPVAKRQLKTAMAEYYRSLELLKGYRALNFTGIRKMIKKFDKTVGVSESQSYMEKVQGREICKSDTLDNLLSQTEGMYAQYFEDGNHKHAVEKLRAKEIPEEHYGAMFLTGIFIGVGLPLFIKAIVAGLSHLGDPSRPDVYFLFQVWGGFFVVNLILVLFTLNLFAWTYYKVNYPFIFELDQRHFLDYRQYGDTPAFLFFLMSLFGWFTFEDFFPETFPARYFPILYLGIAVLIFVVPLPIFHWRARRWLLIAVFRLLLSGAYPVEFRDFFLGDIFTSLNYSISNASFIFCLYATHWKHVYPGSPHASRCSSSQSRLLGFLNCLPGIWRLFQCGRRYMDTGDWFPHLANAAKYTCLILYYMFLSFLRIDQGHSVALRAVFILFAAINAIYASIWDVLMDFSLGNWDSKNWMLRDELAFPKWTYYVMIALDPILRFSWVLYAAYAKQIQQSAKISFFVALIEIIRRFLWAFLRVENEHCTNVARFRASGDLSLPYVPAEKSGRSSTRPSSVESAAEEGRQQERLSPIRSTTMPETPRTSEERQEASPRQTSLKRRGTIASYATPVMRAINSAHARDFERRKVSETAVDDDDDE